MLPTEPVTAKGIVESYGIHLFNDYGIKYKFASESVIFETSQTVKETPDFQITADGKLWAGGSMTEPEGERQSWR